MVISASLQACGVVFPLAMLTSICRSIVTICSCLYLLMGMTRFSSKWILSHSTWYKFRRSRQITYRDAQTYQNVVRAGPLFPLNSLMLHGLVFARQAEHLDSDPGNDFENEVHSYFG